jgi:hypothetical protein
MAIEVSVEDLKPQEVSPSTIQGEQCLIARVASLAKARTSISYIGCAMPNKP